MAMSKMRREVTTPPEFGVFSSRIIQSSIEEDLNTDLRPATAPDTKSVIEFNFTTDEKEYLRLNKTKLYLRMKISITKGGSGSVILDDWKNISVCNNLLNSMFKQVEFWIGDRLVDPPHQTYPYKTYFEKIFGKSNDVKRTSAALGFWTENISNDPETLISDFSEMIKPFPNATELSEGREFELVGKIHLPMFEQRLDLLGGCKLKIKLIPNDPSFYIKCNDKVRVKKIDITECYLTLKGVKVSPTIVGIHESTLNVENARYFLLDNYVIPHTINQGSQDISLDNLHDGITPDRLFVAFVDHQAFNGVHNLNPYNFQNFGVNYLQLYKNGTPVGLPKTPNFKKGWYSNEYFDLFEVTNQDSVDTCITITKDQFTKGFNIFSFRIQPDLVTGGAKQLGYLNPIKTSNIRLHLRFDEPLKKTITALIFFNYDQMLQLTKTRSVIYDHS